ncbi:hypothetical protein [Natrialba asiatica]|uniref:Uncharacterized protein n=1 Tax=Natrialba asiatica (strain ATCC 700177 / DSM 12278 / JCM 9576 / FERM P-10747 / NBRC 102637 / 172P1) TaxID=29540 RepID=M0B3Z1_NATA1|nr:hypothetical protein [Natrialba asiatica]ELZ05500.1 hypothetical protein C481_02237 [Natrialba asiatica DSM 12278]
MGSELTRTHTLECDRFADEFSSVVELVLPETTTARLYIDEAELGMDPDGGACRRAWGAIRPHLDRVPGADRNGTVAWTCPTTTEQGREHLFDLIALTDGVAGAHFVFRVELHRTDAPVLESIPHHSAVGLDATLLGEWIRSGEIVDLPGETACLVPTETKFEWTAEQRRWRIAGGSLCVETIDSRKASCYGLTNLRQARKSDDGTGLGLAWEPDDLPDDAIGRVLSWTMDKLYTPPTAVPCETAARATAVRAHVQEILEAYDGREL